MRYTLNHLECSLSLEHICTLLYALYSEPSRMLFKFGTYMYLLHALYSEPSIMLLSIEHICTLLYALYSEPSRIIPSCL